MNSFKEKVRKNFDNSADTYDSVAIIQKEIASDLVQILLERHPNFKPRTALDIGSGTGFVPLLLKDIYPSCQWTLNDLSQAMLDKARNKLGDKSYKYWQGDLENSELLPHDLIISNLTFQWFDNLPAVLKKLSKNCQVLAFTTLTQGTFQSWSELFTKHNLTSPVSAYPSGSEIEAYCRDLNPSAIISLSSDYSISFDSALEFSRYLRQLGVNSSKTEVDGKKLKAVINAENSDISAEYNVISVIMKFA